MQPSAKYDSFSMKPALRLICAVLLCALFHTSLQAQAPSSTPPQAANPPQAPPSYLPPQNPTAPAGPVPINEEPRHRLLLQNDFTHVYNLMIPALDFTLPHQHDLPYLYITLGPADIINAIVGQPELHQVLEDGEVHYSPGKFTHVVRTDSGVPYHDITVELVRPQGTAKNFCKEVMPGQPTDCPQQQIASGNGRAKKMAADPVTDPVPCFETDEIRVDLYKVASASDYVDTAPKVDALLVALNNANLDANLAGEHISFLHGGDVLWMPAGQHRRIVDFLGTHSSFLLISFKDGTQRPTAQ
jgi:hypothetical protein